MILSTQFNEYMIVCVHLDLASGPMSFEMIYWPNSDKLTASAIVTDFVLKLILLRTRVLANRTQHELGRRPWHTSIPTCVLWTPKVGVGSRANRLRHQNSVNFDVEPIAAKHNVNSSTQSREIGDHGMYSGIGDLLARYKCPSDAPCPVKTVFERKKSRQSAHRFERV